MNSNFASLRHAAISAGALVSAPATPGTLTVEVVDDTGQADAPYILLVGKSGTREREHSRCHCAEFK